MSNSQDPWFIGKNVMIKMCALIPTIQGDNTITYVADTTVGTVVFAGRLDDAGHDEDTHFDSENISPSDCGLTNNVTLEALTTYAIREIMTKTQFSNTPVGNRLRQISVTSFFVKLLIEEFTDANPARNSSTGFLQRAIAYCRIASLSKNSPKGKTVWLGNLETIAVADGTGGYKSNPFFTTTYGTTDIP